MLRDDSLYTLFNRETHAERVHTRRIGVRNNLKNTRDVAGGISSRHFVPFNNNHRESVKNNLQIA